MNTDPQVQAMAIGEIRKRSRNSMLLLLFWLGIRPLCLLLSGTWLTALMLEPVLILLIFGFGVLLVSQTVYEFIQLHRMRNRLRQGHSLCTGRSWRKCAGFYIGKTAVISVLFFAAICVVVSFFVDS